MYQDTQSRKFLRQWKYQVDVLEVLADEERKEYEAKTNKELQVWRPTNLPDADVEAYLKLACDKYNYSLDQAYALLYWRKQDLLEAEKNLEIFTPCPDSWNNDEKLAFEQGYQIYQKDLKEIKEMLPMKTLKEIVEYYYLWKKKGLRQLHFTVDDSDAEAKASKCSKSRMNWHNCKIFVVLPIANSLKTNIQPYRQMQGLPPYLAAEICVTQHHSRGEYNYF